MAFTVLMIVLIPMSYLFTSSVIAAGQSKNQTQALSIAEKWLEIASNQTPPVNCNGEVIVDQSVPPTAPGAPATTVSSLSNNKTLATQTVINVASTTGFAAAPQTVLVATTTGLQKVTYTAKSASHIHHCHWIRNRHDDHRMPCYPADDLPDGRNSRLFHQGGVRVDNSSERRRRSHHDRRRLEQPDPPAGDDQRGLDTDIRGSLQ